ncbi:IclR family transcriptional regulator [Amphritea sp. 2_MG-2023]|jgi:DNA-binding IclR family transcriptional regulator|uniref:IclR family transcriptional regulator n=1 Tax=Amphritea TaxID=515417 RepID=UPI001C06B40D|nr:MULTISPECIES: IclR family transcriptional regulator [Amphritea]MBU2964060.1 IclR family transcriptional regulator [Amphritea atlantica]MDO6418458.1 IclR family transcriptional regulator [Amphritea sp. 2_MG-2023]MDX2423852.1 IclR family transcriptional regulator [Amphritea sp.]
MMDFPREKEEVKNRKFVEALARGLDILRAFSYGGGVLGNQEIAAITGLPKPTVSRMTYTLMELGYLSYSPRLEKYQLDAGVLALGYAYTSNLKVRQVVKPLMDDLAHRTKVSVGLVARERLSMIYVENCRGDNSQSLRMEVGSRLPMETSSAGRAYLAALNADERQVFLNLLESKSGDKWPGIAAGIEDAVTCYEENGYCLSLGDWDKMVNAVAVPFRLQDGKTMCLSVGGPSYLVTAEMVTDLFAPQLIHVVRDIVNMGV